LHADLAQLADALDLLGFTESERGLEFLARKPGLDLEPRRELGSCTLAPAPGDVITQ
jgi:hypothetical protein